MKSLPGWPLQRPVELAAEAASPAGYAWVSVAGDESKNTSSNTLGDSLFALRFLALAVGVAITIALLAGWLLHVRSTRSSHGIAKPPALLNVDLKAIGNVPLNDQTLHVNVERNESARIMKVFSMELDRIESP